MLYAQMDNGQAVPLDSVSISDKQDDISTFSFDVPRNQLVQDPRELKLQSVKIFRGERELISGIIEDASLKLQEDGLMVSFSCLQDIGRMTMKRARANVVFDNQELLFAIAYLLSFTDDFQIGDISTFPDTTKKITMDISGKENLWPQVKQIIDLVPDIFFRYGGYDDISQRHLIDFGSFGEQSDRSLIQGRNIVNLELKNKLVIPIYEIESYGGEYTSGSAVGLVDAIAATADPTLLADPDYPIILKDDGAYVVRNAALGNIPAHGLVSYWNLDEEDTDRFDSHGDNTLVNNFTTFFATGKINQAAQFVAANTEYLSITDALQSGLDITGDMTIACWVYLDTAAANMDIVTKWDTSEQSYRLYYDNAAGRFKFAVTPDGSSATEVTASSFGAPSTNTWYFLCARYDGSNIKISVNSGTVDSQAYTSGIYNGDADFIVGANATGSYFDGRIDEVSIWKRSLDDAEVSWLHNPRFYIPDSEPVSYWRMEEASGDAIDAHGANNLTDNNTVTSTTGKIGNARQFTRANSEYFSITDAAQSGLDTRDEFTAYGWIKADSLPGANMGIMGKFGNSGNRSWVLYVDSGPHVEVVASTNGTALTVITATTFGVISSGTWYFVAFRYDGSNMDLRVNTTDQATVTSLSGALFDSSADFQVGGWVGANNWDGALDGLAFVSRRLTDDELEIIYNSGNGLGYYDLVGAGRAYENLNLTEQPSGVGRELLKTYSDIKPATETPTQDEIDTAALTLYEKTVREIQMSEARNDYSCEVIFPELKESTVLRFPLASQNIHVSSSVSEVVWNTLSNKYTRETTFSVNDNLRILSREINLSGGFETYSLELSGNKYHFSIDPSQQLFKKIDDQTETIKEPTTAVMPTLLSITDVSDSHSSVGSDGDFDGRFGKRFAVVAPAAPAGATKIAYGVSITEGYEHVHVGAKVTLSQLEFAAIVFPLSGEWTPSNSATLTCTFMYF